MWDEVLVFRYQYWSDPDQAEKESSEYATLETIKSLGKPILDSARRVALRDVVEGFYVPVKARPLLEE
ncbi:MAG: hypothetical protein ACM3X5_04385 [Bacillota bacterium]